MMHLLGRQSLSVVSFWTKVERGKISVTPSVGRSTTHHSLTCFFALPDILLFGCTSLFSAPSAFARLALFCIYMHIFFILFLKQTEHPAVQRRQAPVAAHQRPGPAEQEADVGNERPEGADPGHQGRQRERAKHARGGGRGGDLQALLCLFFKPSVWSRGNQCFFGCTVMHPRRLSARARALAFG